MRILLHISEANRVFIGISQFYQMAVGVTIGNSLIYVIKLDDGKIGARINILM